MIPPPESATSARRRATGRALAATTMRSPWTAATAYSTGTRYAWRSCAAAPPPGVLARPRTAPAPRASARSPPATASTPRAIASERRADREQAARDRERAASDLKQAGVDQLTGARRRGTGLEEMRREIEGAARRTNGGLVAAFIDVDDLKSVNDKHGHRAGDELLRDVAGGNPASRMRAYDLVVRVGGDEFLCVLPDVTEVEARRRLDALASDLHDGPALRSVSFGLSELRDAHSLEELIDRADRDLLDGRRQRRSRSSRLGVKGGRGAR